MIATKSLKRNGENAKNVAKHSRKSIKKLTIRKPYRTRRGHTLVHHGQHPFRVMAEIRRPNKHKNSFKTRDNTVMVGYETDEMDVVADDYNINFLPFSIIIRVYNAVQ